MSEPLFDLADEYEAMLMRGVSLSGEHWTFFARGRVDELRRRLPATVAPRRILHFGCGIRYTTGLLAAAFPARIFTRGTQLRVGWLRISS